ncbi:hypothetical protein PR001_g23567 [Phytophthora rubi]|uniref:Uncharacterized protein n=1 Tax=Phytophthora rubi TaxID=129364 RepID=A0A6A3ID66_9STRA|nr:hypothetical protein PR002_g23954 [Phytophthora rubi]KAE8983014.1 hypothetical protein PR001_g23567 [Phytophthora rubi]
MSEEVKSFCQIVFSATLLQRYESDGGGGIGCWNPDGTLRIIDRMKDISSCPTSRLRRLGRLHQESANRTKDKDLKASYEKLCASDSPTGAELKANVSREMDRLVTEYKLSALNASRSSRALGEVHARAIPTFKLKRSLIV